MGALVLAPVSALALGACGTDLAGEAEAGQETELKGSVLIDGSSTVAPLSMVARERFGAEHPGVRIKVGTSGTGGGFDKFCYGETDISDASRPINDFEKETCANWGVLHKELTVANDAMSVVVPKGNDWIDCITTEQLHRIWQRGSKVNSWQQVDPSFPDQPLELYGPDTDSGTFDYFTEAINGEEKASRADFTPSKDDNKLVRGVAEHEGGLGYFGFTYYEENQDKLKALKIDSGDGCVAPSVENVRNGSYTPLARPLFLYASAEALQRPEVEAFVAYYVANHAAIAEKAQYIPLSGAQEKKLRADLAKLKERSDDPSRRTGGDSGGSGGL